MSTATPASADVAAPAQDDTLRIVMRDTMRSAARGFLPRTVPVALTGLVSIYWLGWVTPLCVLAAIAFHEFVLFAFIYKRVVKPLTDRRPQAAAFTFYALLAFGGLLYGMTWLPMLLTGTIAGVFVSASWLWGSIVHNLTYFSRTRAIFIATCAGQIAAAVIAPFFMDVGIAAPLLMAYLTLQTLATVLLSARDRQKVDDDARRDRAARHETEQASVAKSQFLATMSHELRTPLNAIIGYSEILEEDLEDTPEKANPDDARRIRRAARHLLTLINEVLDLSKIEAGRLELINGPVDIAALLKDVEETVRPLGAAHGNRVDLDVVGKMPILDTDGSRLKQCLLNLATNACKFTKDGRVTIRASIENRGGEQVLEVVVADTGIGIKPEDQARLFQPFIQVDGTETRAQDGTGLGLVITRKLAQAMGGDVSMTSTPGLGSTFTLWVKAEIAAEAAPANSAGPLVLVIEDDDTARDLTCRALARLAYNVHATASATEGLAALDEITPDLVILDIHLPDMSGWTVLERIKTTPKGQNLPVLVVTIDDDRARALQLGACDHMVKPVDRDQLTAAAVRYALPRQIGAGAVKAAGETAGQAQAGQRARA